MRNDVRWRYFVLTPAVVLLLACGDTPTAPVNITVDPDVEIQWSGGIVTLRSEQFQQLVLEPLADSTGSVVENRWVNLSVVVGDDTADAWRSGSDRIDFRVPPLYSGRYKVDINATGFVGATTTLQVVGASKPVWGQLAGWTATYHVTPSN